MQIEHNDHVGLAGMYTLTRVNKDTGEVMETLGPFKNVITNIGLERLATGNAMSGCYVGTGSTTPAVSDTTMTTLRATSVAKTAGTTTRVTVSPHWVQTYATWRFNPGAANGNLTEVGVGWGTAAEGPSGRLWSRALILDGAGNPTSITVLPDEYLDVSYALRFYPELGDHTGTLMISGTSHTYTIRSSSINSCSVSTDYTFNGVIVDIQARTGVVSLGVITNTLVGGTIIPSVGTSVLAPYISGSLERRSTLTIGLNYGNSATGISGWVSATSSFGYIPWSVPNQLVITPPIMKDASKILTLGFSVSWGRYTGPIV